MEIPTVNKLSDKYDAITYAPLIDAKVIKDDGSHLVILFGGYLRKRVKKSNLLRVLTPYRCYIKKWILDSK